MLRKRETKLMPCLIQDHGIYYGGGIECPLPEFKIENRETKKNAKEGKDLIIEYIGLEKQIGDLQTKKIELIKKINSNPELQKILAELTKENTCVKSR